MKFGVSPQKLQKYRWQTCTNLGIDLHSSSPEPINFFGAQSSLGGAQAVIWGGTAPECLPWRRACVESAPIFKISLSLEWHKH